MRTKSRLKTRKSLIIFALVVVLFGVGYFVLSFEDPIINYYGVEMRKTALYDFLHQPPPAQADFALHCEGLAPFSFGVTYICFDSEQELAQFMARRDEVERGLK